MQVVAFSTPMNPHWRWRIVNYAGEPRRGVERDLSDDRQRRGAGDEATRADERHGSLGIGARLSVDLAPEGPLNGRWRCSITLRQAEAQGGAGAKETAQGPQGIPGPRLTRLGR